MKVLAVVLIVVGIVLLANSCFTSNVDGETGRPVSLSGGY